MQQGDKVKFVGDRYGNNASLNVPQNIGAEGVVASDWIQCSGAEIYWWVCLNDGTEILACETELETL